MKNFDATRSDLVPLYCYYCGRLIVDGNWFARIKLGDGRVALCRPGCVELFLEHPEHCVGAEGGSMAQSETAVAQSRQAVATAPANSSRAECSRAIATPAMRFVNS